MNAVSKIDIENVQRREDVLRELNLYPLWQLRTPLVIATGQVEIPAVEKDTNSVQVLPDKHDISADTEINYTLLGWAELKKRVKTCTACALRAGCMQTVFGMGDEKADWLFVGSWPTEDDETQGQPFAGQSGQLLDNMLAAIKLKRGDNVYLANIVKCSGSIVRGPQADEVAQCLPYLTRQIQLLQPKVIVALGHAAATTLLAADKEWSSVLNKVHGYHFLATDGSQLTIPLIITHHPAALLLTPMNKAQAWRDLCLARDTMLKLLSAESSKIVI